MRVIPKQHSSTALVASLIVVSWLSLAPPAGAVEVLSAEDLRELCAVGESSSNTSVTPCRTYVLGFLEGAIATDPRVAMRVTEQIEKDESFQARAYRTRLGRDLKRFGPSFLAGFCVPKEVSLSAVTTRVVSSLPASEAGEPAGELVYRALRSNYPCGSD